MKKIRLTFSRPSNAGQLSVQYTYRKVLYYVHPEIGILIFCIEKKSTTLSDTGAVAIFLIRI